MYYYTATTYKSLEYTLFFLKNLEGFYPYSLRPKKSVVLEFQTSYLTIRLIQNFYINIIYFVKTYFIIRDILLVINLFYNLHKNFE